MIGVVGREKGKKMVRRKEKNSTFKVTIKPGRQKNALRAGWKEKGSAMDLRYCML